MTRRLIRLLVTLALGLLTAPLLAEAQPAGKVPTIGLLNSSSATANARPFEGFTQALRELGYIEGQNLAIARRYADGRLERLPALAAELAALNVDMFLVTTNHGAEVVRHMTTTIPIIMTTAEEPVHFGLVKSLARPGGNITGVAVVAGPEIYGKKLEMLTAALPPGARMGVLFAEDLEPAVAEMQHANVKGVVVLGDPLFVCCGHNARINAGAVRSGLAPMWPLRSGAENGGLMAYGASSLERWRRAATYVDKILQGANPADLPMEQPMTFELVINLKTAQALGLTIPPTLLFQATEVLR
jgi:putative ABC transport system substrate-binding protein